MRFLADEGVDAAIVSAIRSDGHDVHTVFEKGRKAAAVKTIHSYHAKEAFP